MRTPVGEAKRRVSLCASPGQLLLSCGLGLGVFGLLASCPRLAIEGKFVLKRPASQIGRKYKGPPVLILRSFADAI